jgi:hypothetical protein
VNRSVSARTGGSVLTLLLAALAGCGSSRPLRGDGAQPDVSEASVASGTSGTSAAGSGGGAGGPLGGGGTSAAGNGSGDGGSGANDGGSGGVTGAVGIPCSPSTDYLKCDGNKVSYCTCTKQGPPVGNDLTGAIVYRCDSYSWVDDEVCAVACDASINPTTGCIASKQPVPECAQGGITCWNGNLTYCLNGYPLPATPCAPGTQCTLVPGCQALCLGSAATADPRCPPTPGLSHDFCANNTAYHCACGYLIGSQVCGAAPNACIVEPSYDGFDKSSGEYALCGNPP